MWRYLANERFLPEVHLPLTELSWPLTTPFPLSPPTTQKNSIKKFQSYLLKVTCYCIIEFLYIYIYIYISGDHKFRKYWSYQSKQQTCKLLEIVGKLLVCLRTSTRTFAIMENKAKLKAYSDLLNRFFKNSIQFYQIPPNLVGGCMSCYLIFRSILRRLRWHDKISWKRLLAMLFDNLVAFSKLVINL